MTTVFRSPCRSTPYPISVVRLRPEVPVTMPGGAEWRPDLFRASEIDEYDYFLVRSDWDRGPELFGTAHVGLDVHVGSWWGYRRLDAGARLGDGRAIW